MVDLSRAPDCPAERKHVLLLADDMSEEGGIRTRILGELSVVTGVAEITLVTKVRAKNLRLAQRAREDIESRFHRVEVTIVPLIPHRSLPLVREFASAFNVLMLVLAGIGVQLSRRPSTVYAHNLECSLAALVIGRLFGLPVTADVHGDEVEENIAITGWARGGVRDRLWRGFLRQVVRRSDTVVCVSEAHKLFLECSYGRRGPTVVIPCCVTEPPQVDGSEAAEIKARVGLDRKQGVWLFYSGSSSRWQMIDSMAQFYRALHETGVDCSFLLLISDPGSIESVKALFSGEGSGNVRVDSVSHEHVHTLASFTDVGLLFRQDIPLNNISSPTKFAEYLISGLPVLITPNVGDFSELVRSERLGKVVELDRLGDSAYATSVLSEVVGDGTMKERCREYARLHLTWSSYAEPLRLAFFGR